MIIYKLALREYCLADEDNRWPRHEVYFRPGFVGPRRMDCAILRTCRAIYAESWHLPNKLREPVFRIDPTGSWINGKLDRYTGLVYIHSPKHGDLYAAQRLLLQRLRRMRGLYGLRNREKNAICSILEEGEDQDRVDWERRCLEIEHLQVFSSTRGLEKHALANALAMPDFHPQRITITIRHVDWKLWETDQRLCVRAGWLKQLGESLSPSTCEVVFELESLKRKRNQVDYIATHMSRYWFLERRDGTCLYADATEGSNTAGEWKGSSVLHDRRWLRDETGNRELEYYVVRVPLRERRLLREGAQISSFAQSGVLDISKMGVEAPGTPLKLPAGEPGSIDWPWGDNEEPLQQESQDDHGLVVFPRRCGNYWLRMPFPWQKNEHPKWDRW